MDNSGKADAYFILPHISLRLVWGQKNERKGKIKRRKKLELFFLPRNKVALDLYTQKWKIPNKRKEKKLDGGLVMQQLSASQEVLLSLFNPDSVFNQHGIAIIRTQMLLNTVGGHESLRVPQHCTQALERCHSNRKHTAECCEGSFRSLLSCQDCFFFLSLRG